MKLPIRLCSAILALAFAAAPAFALSDKEYRRYMKESPVFAASEKDLNSVWKKLHAKLGKEEFRQLLEEQRQWIIHRDNTANSVDDFAQKNIERTQFLKQYLTVGYVTDAPADAVAPAGAAATAGSPSVAGAAANANAPSAADTPADADILNDPALNPMLPDAAPAE